MYSHCIFFDHRRLQYHRHGKRPAHGPYGPVIGTATGTIDGKAFLPTNGVQAMNTQAMSTLLQNHQSGQPLDGTPRAYLKAVLLDDNLQPVQTFSERVNRGSGVVHDYTLNALVPKNGFVYVYTMNESALNVWFDNVTVQHFTGPLLQESAFYPFGAKIVPLSSHAALKTVNERDLQRNERDEEFGVNLSYFHARMYDASIGRFWGVDPEADQQFGLSPYHYGANNPIMMRDPDGRLFFTAAFLVGKFVLKKLAVKGTLAVLAKSKAVKLGVSAAANMVANRKQIGAAAKKGGFMSGLGTALGYGAAGAAVGLNGSGLDAFVAGSTSASSKDTR